MTSAVPTAVPNTEASESAAASSQAPLNMCGPDFPFAYDEFLAHPAASAPSPPSTTAPKWPSSAAACRASWPPTS